MPPPAALTALAAVAAAAAAGGAWSDGPALPIARTENVAVALGGSLYVLGGLAESGAAVVAVCEVDVLDVAAGTWTRAADMPVGLHHVAAAADAATERIYVVGGYDELDPVDTAFVYDAPADAWTALPAMEAPRGAATAQFVDGLLYVIGGAYGWGLGAADNAPSARVERFDPALQRWESLAPLPTAREHLASGLVCGTYIVVAGGRYPGAAAGLTENQVYDIRHDEWRVAAPMPTKRAGCVGAALGSATMVIGGERPGAVFDSVEQYDLFEDTWTALAAMPTARHGLGAAVVDGMVHVMGGGDAPGGAYTDAHEIFAPDAEPAECPSVLPRLAEILGPAPPSAPVRDPDAPAGCVRLAWSGSADTFRLAGRRCDGTWNLVATDLADPSWETCAAPPGCWQVTAQAVVGEERSEWGEVATLEV